jgi:uncharacterized membrane protein YidH (DUF202 family)
LGRIEMNGQKIGNWMLFAAAALWAIGLALWFSFDFFRNEPDANSVSIGIVLLGLGFIGAYAGSNKFYHASCAKNGNGIPRPKPGEWIFAGLVVWGITVSTLYHTKVLWHWKGIDLAIPDHFVLFMGAILTIFTGTKLWDVLSLIRGTNNDPKSGDKPSA